MTVSTARPINKEILDFINVNKIASVCCSRNNKPHCFNCFYSVLEDENCLVFKSSESSIHANILSENNIVAGTVISSEISMIKAEGIQFEGVVTEKTLQTSKPQDHIIYVTLLRLQYRVRYGCWNCIP